MGNQPVANSPTPQNERIHILDILRGFALFGIFMVNITTFAIPKFMPDDIPKFTLEYFSPEAMNWYDLLAQNLTTTLADSKFYTIFSFLFGLGFSVQMARAESKGNDIRSFYPRRLLVLLAIGILHRLLWWGDILRVYALLGFVLLAFRKQSNRTLLIWACIFFAFSLVPSSLPGIFYDKESVSPSGFDIIGVKGLIAGQGPTVMALFLLGLIAGREKFFERLPENRTALKIILGLGLLAGLLTGILMTSTPYPVENNLLFTLATMLGSLALSAAYISGLSLLSLQDNGAKLLKPLSSVGRMALTNYLTQTVVCTILFNGLGLAGNIEAAGQLGIVIVVYALQIPFSFWWLRNFNYGPLEWLWRSLTYGIRQPFRRAK